MSPTLRQQVASVTCEALVKNCVYFKGCELPFLMQVATHLQEVVFAPMELAIHEGQPLLHLTIVRRGVMAAKGRVLTGGRVIGEESIYKEWPAAYSVRSMTFTDCQQLSRTVLLDILQQFPKLLRAFAVKSIQYIFRDEVLAYCDAVKRLRAEAAAAWAGTAPEALRVQLPAPELDASRPSARVRHYMDKLRRYLMTTAEERRSYDRAALSIQRAWRRYRDRQQRTALVRAVRIELAYALLYCAWDSCKVLAAATRRCSRQLNIWHVVCMQLTRLETTQRVFSNGVTADNDTLAVLTEMQSRLHEPHSKASQQTSVLEIARSVPGTGLQRRRRRRSLVFADGGCSMGRCSNVSGMPVFDGPLARAVRRSTSSCTGASVHACSLFGQSSCVLCVIGAMQRKISESSAGVTEGFEHAQSGLSEGVAARLVAMQQVLTTLAADVAAIKSTVLYSAYKSTQADGSSFKTGRVAPLLKQQSNVR